MSRNNIADRELFMDKVETGRIYLEFRGFI
jgi:hypothetical protein